MNCENCGIPDDAYSHPGYKLRLNFHTAEAKYGKNRYSFVKRVVWVCGKECAIQTMYIAAFKHKREVTPTTVKWPMTLREFTARMDAAGKLDFLGGQTGDKPPHESSQNQVVHEVSELNLEQTHAGTFQEGFVAAKSPRIGGRPRKENPSQKTLQKREERAKRKT